MYQITFILLAIISVAVLLLFVYTSTNNTALYNYWVKGINWKLRRNIKGVKVYISNCYNSEIKEFKATINLTTDMNELVGIIYNFENYPKWIQGCKSARMIKENNKNSKIGYIEISFPWPFNNRDMLLNYQISTKTEKMFHAVIISKPDKIPERSGVIRLRNITGSFEFKELSQNYIEVSCQLFIEPKSNIPDRIINLFIVKRLYKSLINIEKLVINKNLNSVLS